MKKYILILISSIVLLMAPGCYTVLWAPDAPMPENYDTDNYYYGDNYYVTYYDYPWWIDVASVYNTTVASPERIQHDRSAVRNPNGGRNPGTTDRPIIQTGPVTVGDGNSSGTTGSTDTGRKRTGEQKTKSASESSSSNSTNTRSNTGSNDDSTRNNNGSRNSGGRK